MSCTSIVLIVFLHYLVDVCNTAQVLSQSSPKFKSLRRLLSEAKNTNHAHNETKSPKVTPAPFRTEESTVGTELAVLFIVVIVILSVIGMVIYFIRKFDQLNRSLPTYRYSSLKTEINGYEPSKNESQALVSVSTEEEDDYEEEDLDVGPPTLLVRSQTVMPSKPLNGPLLPTDRSTHSIGKSGDSSLDSDDELLQ